METLSKIIALAPGSERGVGPELLLKALRDNRLKTLNFFWCGDEASLKLASFRSGTDIAIEGPGKARMIDGPLIRFLENKAPSHLLERQAWFLAEGVRLGLEGQIQAIVTGPIEKEALNFLGPHFIGQTEFFAESWGLLDRKPFMAFMGGPFILSLLTTHLPLAHVPGCITQAKVYEHVKELSYALSTLLKKKRQALLIDVLALNPHAGEGGLMGFEEEEVIIPALKMLENEDLRVFGPWPADGYFGYFNEKKERPDAVVAMYHDQGLAPYKLMSGGGAVNITLGLRIPRLSPAHGTAVQLAGKNCASVLSTLSAILAAKKILEDSAG